MPPYWKSEPLFNTASELENTNHRRDSLIDSRNGGEQTNCGFCESQNYWRLGALTTMYRQLKTKNTPQYPRDQ